MIDAAMARGQAQRQRERLLMAPATIGLGKSATPSSFLLAARACLDESSFRSHRATQLARARRQWITGLSGRPCSSSRRTRYGCERGISENRCLAS